MLQLHMASHDCTSAQDFGQPSFTLSLRGTLPSSLPGLHSELKTKLPLTNRESDDVVAFNMRRTAIFLMSRLSRPELAREGFELISSFGR